MVLSRLLRAGEHKTVRRLRAIADHINGLEDDVVGLSDADLRAKTDEFRSRADKGESLDELLPETFAVVREAAKRTLGQRHFDVQLMGGAALHLGNIAEMRTGEGKTLTSVLPAYLNAIAGKGVHLVTVNDYLAKRDAEWMGRVHRFLGMEVGVILSQMSSTERRAAYHADITYGTNNELGFDYLRDNMAWNLDDCVQRGHSFAIVDEVDSILIDEARTPLIISGPADQSSRWYGEFARLAPMLKRDVHYEVDERKRTVGVSEEGVALVEDQLGIENLYEAANTPLVGYLNNALKAKELYAKDKDYIVRDGEVLIVDEFTGRLLQGRRYNEGMHQAIEAKEKVEIKAENQTLATITIQNYFRLYDKLAGMTGTAQTEAAELSQIYKLGVVPIPTNKPMIRSDLGDLIYKHEESKFAAVVADIAARHAKGQPVLVGTVSVEKSELLSQKLTRIGIAHEVINAKNHAREAEIIAQAGQVGAVTIATNMAGRGVDIVLGGGDPSLGIDPAEILAERLADEAAMEPVKKKADQIALEHAEQIALRSADKCSTAEKEAVEATQEAYVRTEPSKRAGRSLDPAELAFNKVRNDKIQAMLAQVRKEIKSAMSDLGASDDLIGQVQESATSRTERAVLKEEKGASSRQRKKGGQGHAQIVHNAVYGSAYELIYDHVKELLKESEYDAAAYAEVYPRALKRANKSREQVRELGGLYVLGTERHESRRIDNQLRGRSGRQGDPGESRFYLSLRDELMVRFNGPMVESIMTRLRMEDDIPIEAKMVSRAIQSAQTQVEQQNFEIRKNVLKYDEVMDLQRKVIYAERRRVLEGEDLREQIEHMMTDVITAYVDGATENGYAEDWDLDKLWTALKTLYPVGIKHKDLGDDAGDLTREVLLAAVLDDARAAYARREATLKQAAGEGAMRELERRVVLSVLDRKWREHLYEMDYLKEGIGLRAMAQRDPLVEYKREGFEMFSALLEALKEESVGFLFNVQVQVTEPVAENPAQTPAQVPAPASAPAPVEAPVQAPATPAPATPVTPAPVGSALSQLDGPVEPASRPLTYTGPTEGGGTEVRQARDNRGRHASNGTKDQEPSRNAPCPCGSGRKYKRCHGAPTTARS